MKYVGLAMAAMMVLGVVAAAEADVVALKRDAGIVTGGNLAPVFSNAITGATIAVLNVTVGDAPLQTPANSQWNNNGIRTLNNSKNTLYKFDVAAAPGLMGGTINLAELRIVQNNGNSGTRAVGYVASYDWLEGTKDYAYPGAAGGCSFAHPIGYNTGPNQDAAGGTSGPLQSWGDGTQFFSPANDGAGQRGYKTLTGGNLSPLVFDVTDIVTAWADGSKPNYGFYTPPTSNYQYRMSEYSANDQPVLFIDYVQAARPVPEPAGLSLLGLAVLGLRKRRS